MANTTTTQNIMTTENISNSLFFAFGFFLMEDGMEELTQPTKNITHELFETIDSLSDQLKDQTIKDLKEKLGELYKSVSSIKENTVHKIIEGCHDLDQPSSPVITERERQEALTLVQEEIESQQNLYESDSDEEEVRALVEEIMINE